MITERIKQAWHRLGVLLLRIRQFFELIYKSIVRIWSFELTPCFRNLWGNELTKELTKYKNLHQGKRIFILATGPSLRKEDIEKLRDQITIGVNGIVTLYEDIKFKPTYYCVSDTVAVDIYKDKLIGAELDAVFWGRSCKKYEKEMNFKPVYFETVIKGSRLPFNTDRTRKNMSFHEDIYKNGVYGGGRSIVCIAMQIAAYMGASEIVLYAQDCDFTGMRTHFNNQRCDGDEASMVESMMTFFECAKEYADKKGIKIINATRGGKLEIFERKDLDSLIKR